MKTEIVSKMVKIVLIAISLTTGVDPDYDQALADIQKTRAWFDQYLKKQCAALGCKVSVQLIALFPFPCQPHLRAKIARVVLLANFYTFLFVFVQRIW